jgi:oxygen-dependent protoporphyrinogen oxidase
MNHEPSRPKRIAVIGGGISGLSAAHRLLELAPNCQVTLFESSDRLGGVIRTERCDDYLVEHGADMVTTREPWALDLCRRLGIESELINTNSQHARAFVVRRGRLYPVPDGFALMSPGKAWPIIKTPLLGVGAKLRMAWEYFVPARMDGSDESLEQFVTRRLGRQAYERLVQPLIGGIYTADPTKLSMQAALPQFVEMERTHGGLLRAIRRSRPTEGETRIKSAGARYGLFVAPRGGMQTLLDALVASLSRAYIRCNAAVRSLTRAKNGGWTLQAGEGIPEGFDAVIVAAPAQRAADLLVSLDETLAEDLRGIEYASVAIVVFGFRRNQFRHPLDGFGLVVPQIEHRGILAASLASVKFPGRASEDRVLMRVFIGGACQPELVELPDNDLRELAVNELAELLGVSGAPELFRVVRWRKAMPQYHVGHLDRVARIEQRLASFPDLALAGNAYRGVGIPFCIRSGEQAAEKILRSRHTVAVL